MNVVLYNPRAQRSHRRLPLSLLALARVVPAPHTWTLVDDNVDREAALALDRACALPDTVLFVTVMPGPQLRVAVPVCRALKARFPHLRIWWGGYFPGIHTDACLAESWLDGVVTGLGEPTIPALLRALASGGGLSSVPGIAWREGADVRRTPGAPIVASSSYPDFPYERVDMQRYAARTFLGERTYNHHSSVGCPYVCNFCAVVNVYAGRWLPDPAEHVVRVARRLAREYRADAIEMHDNNFFAWEKRTREVADGIVDLHLSWWGEGRIDTMLGFSGETWEAMARSGLRMVFYGAESGDDEVLARMDKGGLRVADIGSLNRLARRHGIRPEFSFVLGTPGDPEQEAERTFSLIRTLKRENPDCEIILYLYTPVPLPGMFDTAAAGGFAFPKTLDDWLNPPWSSFAQRRNPLTPWITPRLIRRVSEFETVLNARYPTYTDVRLGRAPRRVLQALGRLRWEAGVYRAPLELRLLHKLLKYRQPEEMGF